MSNYPAGAKDDPRAPYNQDVEKEPKEFSVELTATLTGIGTFTSDEYSDGPDVYYNGEALESVMYKRQNITPLELITDFKELLERLLAEAEIFYLDVDPKIKNKRISWIKERLKACSVWTGQRIE